jgi:hypothetical protein
MRVQVDESRRGNEIAQINNAGGGFNDGRRDPRDRIAANGNISTVPGAPGSINHAGIAHYNVVRQIGSSTRARHRRPERDRDKKLAHVGPRKLDLESRPAWINLDFSRD